MMETEKKRKANIHWQEKRRKSGGRVLSQGRLGKSPRPFPLAILLISIRLVEG